MQCIYVHENRLLSEFLLGLERIRQLGSFLLGAGAAGYAGYAGTTALRKSHFDHLTDDNPLPNVVGTGVKCTDHQVCFDLCLERYNYTGWCMEDPDNPTCYCTQPMKPGWEKEAAANYEDLEDDNGDFDEIKS